jgi:hypothetical protein
MSQTISVCVSDSPTHIVVWQESKKESVSEVSMTTVLSTVEALTKRIAALENQLSQQRVNATFFPSTISPTPSGLEVLRAAVTQKVESPPPTDAIKQVTINLPTSIPVLEKIDVEVPEEVVEEEVEVEEEMEVEEEVEEEEEEDVMQLEPFEWKGVTYYKDSDNQVYQTDADGDIDDSPIGVWNETKQKIVKFAATT